MDILNLYKIVDKEKIDIENYKWTNCKARIFEIDNNYYISMDYSKIDNSIEEKEVLAEELGHYYCNALYYINSDKEFKSKCESRAKKWSFSVLVPLQKLKEKIEQGLSLYDLAEYFDVDCNYMKDCINFYTEKYGFI